MKKKISHFLTTGVLVCALSLSLFGCGTPGPSGNSSSAANGSAGGAVVQPIELLLGSSHSGGTYYQWCVPASQIISQNVENVTCTPITTVGAAETMNLMDTGECQVGGGTGSIVYFAYTGQGEWADYGPITNFGIMYATYPDYFHIIVPADSDINSLSDLEGKRLSINTMGNGANQTTLMYFEALGIEEDWYQPYYLSTAESSAALQEGSIDAMIFIGGAGASAALELASTRTGMKLVPFSEEEIKILSEAVPVVIERTIPAGTYPGVDYDVQTVGGCTVLCANLDVPEEVVYQAVKALNEHHDEHVEAISVAEYSTPENTVSDWKGVIPFHPGAERYFRELGLID